MKNYAILLNFMVWTYLANAQPIINNVFNRNIASLNGKWHIIIDPYDNGYYDYRMQENPWGFFRNQKPANKSERIEYDFDKSETLNVPGDWNSQKPELLFYEGSIWYKRSFDYSLPKGKKLFLWFGAVNYQADVYLNGKKLGSHEGGFTPFYFEITNFVQDKDNFVVVRVNNQRKADGVPTINTDWWNYGGITRDVLLIEEDSIFIQNYHLYLNNQNPQQLRGWVQLNNNKSEEKVRIEIPELKLIIEGKTDEKGVFTFDRKINNLVRWEPLKPKLYTVYLYHGRQIMKDNMGFRTITTQGNKLFINEKPIFLKGICIHEEMPMRKSRANGYDDAKTLLGWAQELGCNFVRLAHYPHNEYMVRMADSLGLLVWSEIPVYWTIQFDNPKTYQLAEKMLTENIGRDQNRASIIIWSVGNETPVHEARIQFMKNLALKAKQLDPTRLVSAAMEVHVEPSNPFIYHVDDPLGEYLDVIACNEYVGWYDGLPDKTEKITWQTKYNKPFVFSELGACALFGHHGDSLTRWTEEYQEYFFNQQIKMLNKVSFLTGVSPWILADFRSPRRQLPGIQDFWNRKGLISDQGQRKKAFYVIQKYYKTR
ncbi:MAG: beta-glucuronidase [Bacteroidales bacterium]|nr:beta-glucuronidase [Bacteroidales bacterium]